MENGFPFSIFDAQLPISIFHFPISSFGFEAGLRTVLPYKLTMAAHLGTRRIELRPTTALIFIYIPGKIE